MKKEARLSKISKLPDKQQEPNLPPPTEARQSNKIPTRVQPGPNQTPDFGNTLTVRLPKSLHTKLDHQAALEGIPLPEYVIYILSQQ